jgi:hypothetical protein
VTVTSSVRSASRSATDVRRPRHQFSKKDRKVGLSIKALEIAEEKEAVAQYGSSDSGASLGDILGATPEVKSRNPPERSGGFYYGSRSGSSPQGRG